MAGLPQNGQPNALTLPAMPQPRTVLPFSLALAMAVVATTPAVAVTLYDPALGSLPTSQGWATLADAAAGSQALVHGRLVLDTTGAGVNAFGNGRSAPQPLDTAAGFALRWQLQVAKESHSSDNRAGFSVLLQGADQRQALELGFWSDSVWALGYSAGAPDSGFVRAETAAFDTTAALRAYSLLVQAGRFSLTADGQPLLAGALRDYPVLGLSTLVYGASNYLFFGDNSARGQALVQMGTLQLLPVPEPAVPSLWALGLGLLAWRRRRR